MCALYMMMMMMMMKPQGKALKPEKRALYLFRVFQAIQFKTRDPKTNANNRKTTQRERA